jgi:hypothetical protein
MNTTQAAERYVAGRMSEDEERGFEVAMLESPELAADVDVRQRMKVGLRQLEQRGELQKLLSQPDRRAASRMPLAVAASVLIVLIGAALFWVFRGVPGASAPIAFSASQIGSRGISATYVLASTRAGDTEAIINLPANAAPLRLRLVPESPDATEFTASLVRVTPGGEVDAAPAVRVTRGQVGFVEVFLDPARLSSGSYRLRMAREEYSFTLNVQP